MTAVRLQEAKQNPAAVYDQPDDVLQDANLTRGEKIDVLRQWYQDANQLQTAADENMTGGEPDRLRSVSKALLALGVSPANENDPHSEEVKAQK
jgi:hypothetical protein